MRMEQETSSGAEGLGGQTGIPQMGTRVVRPDIRGAAGMIRYALAQRDHNQLIMRNLPGMK
jgi:hypothetical protein